MKKLVFIRTEEPRNKASANKENPPITTWIFSPQMLFLLILYIGNKASLAIRHEINWSLEMRYCGVPLYAKPFEMFIDGDLMMSVVIQIIL